MPNRLLTLVLCLVVLMPQQLCACHWVGCHGSPVSDPESGDGGARTCDCAEHTKPVSTPAVSHPTADITVGHPAPGCPCCCHSHPDGDPSDCSHSATDAVVDPPKPIAIGDVSDLPVPFLSVALPSAARSTLLDRSHSPPRAHPVPLYITFCSLRN